MSRAIAAVNHTGVFVSVNTLEELKPDKSDTKNANTREYEPMEYEPDEPVVTQPPQEVEEPGCHRRVEDQPQLEEMRPRLVEVQSQLYKISPPGPECMPPEGRQLFRQIFP